MQDMISYYIEKLTKEDIKKFALQKQINLSPNELDFTYNFIKNNYQVVLSNPHSFDFSLYQKHYSKDNFNKINNLIKIYLNYL